MLWASPPGSSFYSTGKSPKTCYGSELVWPEPHVGIQTGLGTDGGDAKILEHKGNILLYAVGRFEEEIELDSLTVKLSGLTCQDDGVCIPYGEEVEVYGDGTSRIWKDFPEDLLSEDSGSHTRGKLYVRHGDGETRVVIVLDVEGHWHVFDPDIGDGKGFGEPMSIALEGKNLTWGLQHWPKPYVLVQEKLGPKDRETGEYTDAWIRAHEGKIVIRTSGLIAPDTAPGEITAKVVGQECKTGGLCIPLEMDLKASGKGADDYFAEPFPPYTPADTAAVASDGADEEEFSLWNFLGLAVTAGLITLLMPCTYPMIPITISFFTKQADAREGNVLPLSLTYGAGIVLIFVLIGVVFGAPIVRFAAHGITNLVIGVMFIYFALTLFGVIDLQPPRFMMNMAGQASMKGGVLGVFLMGATLVITSFTCTAPFVGSLLSVAASTGEPDLVRAGLGMGVFGLTMAIPFVYLSLVPGKLKKLPRSGEWMKTLKVTLGFVELAASLKFLSNVDIYYHWRIFPDHIFLPVWIAIFFVAGMYLIGVLAKGAKISVGRRLAGVGFIALCVYWGLGMARVVPLDRLIKAMKPPYGEYTEGAKHEVFKDDYSAALTSAEAQDKLLLINFTGFV